MYTKKWIIENSIPIVRSYEGNLTLRGLHYRLVALGMTNDVSHYKKVVNSMIFARWAGLVDFDDFLDHERETHGKTANEATTVEEKAIEAKEQIKLWATSYMKNRWENQEIYPEVFIEKKALQGVFIQPCKKWNVALNPCKGYPSLTFQFDAANRFKNAISLGKKPLIFYFGDYDCSGEDIPRSIKETLFKMGVSVEVVRVALMEHQVIEWQLPPAPTKIKDTRSQNWDGLGQVELDAVEPEKIVQLFENSISSYFNHDLYKKLMEIEKEEIKAFKKNLRDSYKDLLD